MRKRTTSILYASVAFLLLGLPQARSVNNEKFILYLRADNKFERSAIADEGIAIEGVRDGMVIAIGDELDREKMERLGFLVSWTPLAQVLDFPAKDAAYHNYDELLSEMRGLESLYPQLVKIESIGRSVQGRQIPVMKISGQLNNEKNLPAIIFLGGHHAREHLSVETCFRIFRDLVHRYGQGDARVMALFDNRVIHVIPAVNPDGLEYDIEGGSYKMWRKNRRLNNNGTYGVDLNRNYSYKWGTGGSSNSPSSDTYMGPSPFSEPETQAVKAYIEARDNITILLSFHTFSELILYPWGHTYNKIQNNRDYEVHKKMAEKMAQWNGYKPQQSSDLYIASGDTTDWSYGEHGIISFTFELDPANQWSGGFYPGAGVIDNVVAKNTEPVLYLIGYADDPYRVLKSSGF